MSGALREPGPEQSRKAAALAATLLRRNIEQRRTQLRDEQGVLFDDFGKE